MSAEHDYNEFMARSNRYMAMAFRCQAEAYRRVNNASMVAHCETLATTYHDQASEWDAMAHEETA